MIKAACCPGLQASWQKWKGSSEAVFLVKYKREWVFLIVSQLMMWQKVKNNLFFFLNKDEILQHLKSIEAF